MGDAAGESLDVEDALALARDGDPLGISAVVDHVRSTCGWAARHRDSAESTEQRWDPTDSEDQMVYDQHLAADAHRAMQNAVTEAQETAVALAETGTELALEALEEMANDDDPLVRETASFALAKLGGPQAVAPLLGILRRAVVAGDKKLIDKTTRSLERIGSSGAAELADGLRDDNAIVRWTAATLLGRAGGAGVVSALTTVAADDPDDGVRDAAAVAVAVDQCQGGDEGCSGHP